MARPRRCNRPGAARLECMCREQHLADAAAALDSPWCLRHAATQGRQHTQHNSHCARRVRLCPLAHLLARSLCAAVPIHSSVYSHLATVCAFYRKSRNFSRKILQSM